MYVSNAKPAARNDQRFGMWSNSRPRYVTDIATTKVTSNIAMRRAVMITNGILQETTGAVSFSAC